MAGRVGDVDTLLAEVEPAVVLVWDLVLVELAAELLEAGHNDGGPSGGGMGRGRAVQFEPDLQLLGLKA